MNIVAEREKKSETLGGPAEGCPAEGCPAEGGSPEGGSSGRVRGFGFSSGFWGRRQTQNENKMKREMSKNKRKVMKSKKTK